MTSRIKEKLVVAGAIVGFLVFKFAQISFRFGDGNAYIYMANHILQGFMPYRDFFLADPPLFVYLLAFFKLLVGKNIILFQAIPIIFEAATAWVIYLLFRQKQISLAWLAPLAYLFSFTAIATSDFLTGIQPTLFFLVLAFWFAEKQKDVWAGVFLSLACLIKLYAFPILLGFYLYYAIQKRWSSLVRMFIGSFAAALVVCLPSLIMAHQKVWEYIVVHQLNRPAGNNKSIVWQFLFRKEWALLLLGVPGLFVKAARPYVLPAVLMVLFLLWFKDLYYVYFQGLILLAALGAAIFISWWWDSPETKPLAVIPIIGLLGFTLYSLTDYQAHNSPFGRITNAHEMADYARTLEHPLYGTHEVAPLIALLAEKKLFNNYIDTNGQAFASNGQNLKQASEEAVARGIYLIARITDRPDLGIPPTGYEGYFDSTQFQYCKVEKEFPSTSRELDNKIVFYFCSVKNL